MHSRSATVPSAFQGTVEGPKLVPRMEVPTALLGKSPHQRKPARSPKTIPFEKNVFKQLVHISSLFSKFLHVKKTKKHTHGWVTTSNHIPRAKLDQQPPYILIHIDCLAFLHGVTGQGLPSSLCWEWSNKFCRPNSGRDPTTTTYASLTLTLLLLLLLLLLPLTLIEGIPMKNCSTSSILALS